MNAEREKTNYAEESVFQCRYMLPRFLHRLQMASNVDVCGVMTSAGFLNYKSPGIVLGNKFVELRRHL